jgi:hypothetical protein
MPDKEEEANCFLNLWYPTDCILHYRMDKYFVMWYPTSSEIEMLYNRVFL